MLKEGKGITKKYSESLYWAFLSKLGNIEKADDLVSELVDLVPEKTVETVREEVKNYLVNSIESGSKTSIMHLGKFFLEIVEEKEYPSAYKWFTVGAALGLENAEEMRDNVEEELSPDEIIEEQDSFLLLHVQFQLLSLVLDQLIPAKPDLITEIIFKPFR